MKGINETDKVGLYVLLINIAANAFFMTSKGNLIAFWISSIVSSIIALIFNILFLRKSNKKIINIITLIINIIILIGIVIYGYFYAI